MLGGRFLTAFAATLFSGLTKGGLLAIVVITYKAQILNTSVLVPITMIMIIFFLPFLLALFSTIGFSKDSFKMLLIHPELVIMPTGYHTITFLKYMHIE